MPTLGKGVLLTFESGDDNVCWFQHLRRRAANHANDLNTIPVLVPLISVGHIPASSCLLTRHASPPPWCPFRWPLGALCFYLLLSYIEQNQLLPLLAKLHNGARNCDSIFFQINKFTMAWIQLT
jgi:hypothetical protein